MYRRLASLLLLGIMITSVNAAPSTSVGVINSERVLLESKRGQAIVQSLNAQMHEKRAAISALQLEIEEIEQRLSSSSLPPASRNHLQSELQQRRFTIKQQHEELEQETSEQREKHLRQFALEVDPLIKQVARREGIELILDTTMGRGVIFVDESIDITDKVMQLYDAQK
ncbi:MAG: OmpH family outer membrane protein [Gammaproteobacteria bacterium]|jgi:outer membrane protein